ncbi:MAG: peptidoglycan-binding domain-containing protein [Candidatus Moranbacteria bacterium]|nr:peptidoglycan-binding domain-containing protein [Candidatus Moranbacteria bacterium]
MKKNFLGILVFGVLSFALSFSFGQAKTITMDGEFDDWSNVPILVDDSITGYPYSGTIYHFDNSSNSWVVGSDTGACMYTANRALDVGQLKITNDENYLYILWQRGSDFLNYYWRRGDATEEYQFSSSAAPSDNSNPCAGEIVTAPVDFNHDLVLSIDKDKDGSYDYYLVINVSFSTGAYGSYDTAGYIYEDNGNGTYDRSEETLLTTFGTQEYDVSPSASAVMASVLQEVRMDIGEIFDKLDLDWGESVYVRYEAHSSATDQTDSAQYTFEEPDDQTAQKARIESWKDYQYENNNGISCPQRLVLEIKGKHFTRNAEVKIGGQEASSVEKKSSKKIIAKFCLDDLLDVKSRLKRKIHVINPDAEDETADKKINLANIGHGGFSAKNFDPAASDGVLNIQRALISLGFLDGQCDTGFYGPLTTQAVKEFQQKYEIDQTGYVGPLTRAELEKRLE